jgi:hypothetical protein
MPGARHNDFGHSGKAFWMAMLVGRQIGDRNMLAWARASAQTLLAQAYDGDDETWASRWTADGVDSGRTWWIHAELDQLAAALAVDGRFDTDRLARTQTYWLRHFVDRRYGEVYGGLSPAGEPPSHSLKQHQWKNGYHSTEHALVGYLAWHALRREPAPLYFATPPGARLTPYFFEGSVVRSERVGSFDGQPITRVHFFLQTDR